MPRVRIEGVGVANIDAEPGSDRFNTAVDEIKRIHGSGTQVTGEFDPNIPSPAAPIGMLGGMGVTSGDVKQMQAAAQTGEKVLRTAATAAAVPATFAALGPFAAGAPLGTAIGIGAATGAVAGVAKQAVDWVLGGEKKDLKDRSLELGIDTVLGGGGEVAIRTGNQLLKLGGEKVLTPLIARAAVKADQGLQMLKNYGVRLKNGIQLVTKGAGEPKIATQGMLDAFNGELANIRTGASDAMKARLPDLMAKIHAAEGDLASMVEIKGTVSQMAYKGQGFKFEESAALGNLRDELDRTIKSKMKQIGGKEGEALYKALNENWNQVKGYDAGLQFAGETLKRVFSRSIPAMIGGGAGYYEGKKAGTAGGIVGAAAGATLADTLVQRTAPWVLQRLLTDKATGTTVRLAINKATQGELKEAEGLFRRAFVQSGIQEILAPIVKEKFKPEEAPNAAP